MGLVRLGAAQLQRCQLAEPRRHVHVEVLGVVGVHRGGDVLPVVVEGAGDLLGGGDRDEGAGRQQVQRRAEALDRQQLGDLEALAGARRVADVSVASCPLGCRRAEQLGGLAVLAGQLGGRSEDDALGVAERALGEGGEPADALDLVAEELDPHGPLLGRRIDVENVAALGELAPLLDLIGALVARLDEQLGHVAEGDLLAAVQDKAVGAELRVGDRLGERDGARDDDQGGVVAPGLSQGIERRHAQAGEMRRRRDVREVAGAARRVEVDRPGRQVGAQVGREVPRRAVVTADDQRGAGGGRVVEQGREHEGAEGARNVGLDGLGAASRASTAAASARKPSPSSARARRRSR